MRIVAFSENDQKLRMYHGYGKEKTSAINCNVIIYAFPQVRRLGPPYPFAKR